MICPQCGRTETKAMFTWQDEKCHLAVIRCYLCAWKVDIGIGVDKDAVRLFTFPETKTPGEDE